jgi:hypothetical protein
MNVFVPKDDKLRHEILREFNVVANFTQFSGHGTKGIAIDIKDIARHIKSTPEKVKEVSKLLIAEGDMLPHFTAHDDRYCLMSTDKTISAYLYNKYLNYRWGKMRENIDFFIRLTAIFSLLLSVFATINTCNNGKDKNKAIEDLQIRVRGLESKSSPVVQQKK